MPPAPRPSRHDVGRARRLLLPFVLVLAALGGLQAGHPARAAAADVTHAVDDLVHLQANGYYTSAAIGYLANDELATVVALTDFPDDQPAGATPSADHRVVTFANGTILQMTPQDFPHMELDFSLPGTYTARYRITDYLGGSSSALVTLVVGPGGGGSLQFLQGQTASVDVLAGDVPGYNADGTRGTLDPTSVHFDKNSDLGTEGATVSSDGRTLTDPVRGVFRASPTTGVITLVPAKSFRGSSPHVSYVARDTTRDADGNVEHHSYRGNLDLWVTAVDPRPVNDVGATVHHATVTLPGLTDDRPGDRRVPLRGDLSVFVISGSWPEGTRLYDRGRGLKVPGQGWWTLDAAGTISFTPVADFVGSPQPAVYTLVDANGTKASGREQVTVAPGPQAARDTATTAKGTTVVVDVPGNDTPGKNADLTAGTIDRTTVHFPEEGQPTGALTSRYGRTLTVPGRGVYSADLTSGKVTFRPEAGFSGPAGGVTYSVRDTVHRTDGRVVHNLAVSTLDVAVSR